VENFLAPSIVIREIEGTGRAAFTQHALPRGTVVATFGGTASDAARLGRFNTDRVSRSIQIDDHRFLVGPQTAEPGDFLNHSCEPNCGMRNATQVATMRDVEAGEELTFDYAMTDTMPYDEFTCRCRAPGCRGSVRAGDWMIPDLRERYKGWFAPHVARRITAERNSRRLGKTDVERLMNRYDEDPIDALTTALRIVTGRPHASWETLVAMLPDGERLATLETTSLDRLAAEMNETRTIRLDQRIDRTSDES
jgi:hypothetical protein